MCEFVSWVEYKDEIYFLSQKDLQTKEGRRLLKETSHDDIAGHGAIRAYYPELGDRGTNKECSDFCSPSNFPEKIVEAIKNGDFEGMGICEGILTGVALAKYEKVRQPAYAEYKKVWQSAYAKYEKVKQSAYAEYKKVEQPAYAKYKKVRQPAYAEYKKVEQSAFWEIAKKKENRIKIWK